MPQITDTSNGPSSPKGIPTLKHWQYLLFLKTSIPGFIEVIFQSLGQYYNCIPLSVSILYSEICILSLSPRRVYSTFKSPLLLLSLQIDASTDLTA